MKHLITAVDSGSTAEEIGVEPGWRLLAIDGEAILDIIDYEQLMTKEVLTVSFETKDGEEVEAEIEKDLYETLGLNFESGLMSPIRHCKNHCGAPFIVSPAF